MVCLLSVSFFDLCIFYIFFFSSRRRHTRCLSDWSSDVCSSDLLPNRPWISEDPLEELRGLATTAGAHVVGALTQRRQSVIPGTYIGKGKLAELHQIGRAHV